jgi:hypothetical protein
LITTDAVSVYSFTDMDAAAHMAQVAGDGAHRQDGIVLMYAGTRTPEDQQAVYEAELSKFLGRK